MYAYIRKTEYVVLLLPIIAWTAPCQPGTYEKCNVNDEAYAESSLVRALLQTRQYRQDGSKVITNPCVFMDFHFDVYFEFDFDFEEEHKEHTDEQSNLQSEIAQYLRKVLKYYI